MTKFLKITSTFLLLILAFTILHLNVKQYYQPQNNHIVNQEVINQLHFLEIKIHDQEAEKMQAIFPEGFVFFNAIYGLTWCELIADFDTNATLYKEGIDEIDYAIKAVESKKGKQPFDADLTLPYGAFYQGWSTYLLGKKLLIRHEKHINSDEEELFSKKCEQIAKAYSDNETIYLESYHSGTWQADNMVCIASLALHDNIFEQKYALTIETFVQNLKTHLNVQTGLIPHSTTERNARGSSQSLMNVFLPEIDSTFSKEIFKKYKNNFLDNHLGLVGIREYPKEISGGGDIDSGPVIWDMGAVATIVGIKAMAIHKDFAIAKSLRNNVEGLAFPITSKNQKSYFFGTFPMADVFIAWANVSKIDEINHSEETNSVITFLLISLLILLSIFGIIYLMFRK